MDDHDVLTRLIALAGDLGLRVDRVAAQPPLEGLAPGSSAACTLRGQTLVLLSDSDPLAVRVALLAHTLVRDCGDALEGRFLPPAVRVWLDRANDG